VIRDAVPADLPRILEITNDAILNGTALWTIIPATLETRTAWMQERQSSGFPVLVAEHEGSVLGFGSYGPFRPHDGFLHTVEHSLYIDPGSQRLGLGKAMLGALIERARAHGKHVMVGAIATENLVSITLHERFGFTQAATLPQVGRKFDRWLDLTFMHRLL